MKKTYKQPAVSVTRTASASIICTSTLNFGGSGSAGSARAPEQQNDI